MALVLTSALLIYLWNPFGAPNWNPIGRFTGRQYFKTPGEGMQSAYAPGTSVLVCFDAFKNRPPRVNEIVVFRIPNTDEIESLKRLAASMGPTVQVRVPDNKDILYLKRVAAVGGSTIEIRDSLIIVDGGVVSSPFWWEGGSASQYVTTLAPTQLPSHTFFALGDNLVHSIDSRRFGPVSFDNVVGGLCAQQAVAADRPKTGSG